MSDTECCVGEGVRRSDTVPGMRPSLRARLIRRTLGGVLGGPGASLEQRRAAMERAGRFPLPRHVDVDERQVGGVRALVVTPTAVPPDRHVVYLHGGGYIVGSPTTHLRSCARLAKRAGATVTIPDYRLAPEHPYPAAIDDCVAAYRSIAAEVAPSSVTIAGDSAGGGATLATLCRLRDAGDPLPACAYLLSPWTDLTLSGDSMHDRAEADPMLDEDTLAEMASHYAAGTPRDDPGISPLFADLTGLPPLLIHVGADEVLLDDSVRLADRAAAAGVPVELDVADDMWHVYPALDGIVPEATAACIEAASYIRAMTPAVEPVPAS